MSPHAKTPAILANGFRPLFWLASAFSVGGMGRWLGALFGGWRPGGVRGVMAWHAHEMIFGFTVAVVAGFLLTAVSRWTGRETATGPWLLGLAALWLAGRGVMLASDALPGEVVAAVDLAFLPGVILAIGRPIVSTRNTRNYLFVLLLAVLWGLNLTSHLAALGVTGVGRTGVVVAVDVIVVIIVVITGRIVPMFTRNATKLPWIRGWPAMDRVATAATLSVIVAGLMAAPAPVTAAMAALAAGAVALRTRHWGLAASFRDPLLWILHLGHGWVVIGLGLRALAGLTPHVPQILATHALTAGGIGSLTLGMMVRVGLGHTGRPLRVDGALTFAFVLVTLAAVVRVAVPLLHMPSYRAALAISGPLWALAFGLHLWRHHRILTQPRVDGQAG